MIEMPSEANLLILLVALLFDAAIGDPAAVYGRVWHPVAAMGRLIGVLEAPLNRETWSDRARRSAGTLLVAVLAGAAAAAGIGVHWLFAEWPWGWFAEGMVASALIAQNSLYHHVREVARALRADGPAGGRAAVAHIVGRDPATLDENGVARAAIESLAESFSDGVVAPAFWLALLGLPGLFVYKAVNTADSMVGYRNDRYRAFGWAAARLDDGLNLVPARLSAALLVLAAFLAKGCSGSQSWRMVFRDAGKTASPNAGYPESAMAGALRLRLAGPRVYGAETLDAPWLGGGTPDATPEDIVRGLKLFVRACVLLALVVVAITFAVLFSA